MHNPRLALTDVSIRNLPFAPAQTYVWDASFPSLGLRIGKRSKVFIAMRGNGKRLTLGKYPLLSLKEARQRLAAILRDDYTLPRVEDAPKAMVIAEQYLAAQAARTRPNTQYEARRILNRHFLPRFAHAPINQITTQQLAAMLDDLLARPSEAIKTQTVVSGLMTWALRRGILARNPLAGMPLPAKPRARDRVLTDEELGTILSAAARIIDTPYGLLITVLIHTGLRKNEAYNLTWSRISEATLTIPKEQSKNGVELVLPNTLHHVLPPRLSDGRLFPRALDLQQAKLKFDRSHDVRDYMLHDFRRTLSTKMAEWDIAPPDVVEAILNHKTGSRTPIQRTYDRHNRLPQMRRALQQYASRLRTLIVEPATRRRAAAPAE